MEWLSPVLMAVQVISSLSVIVLVLLQQGKGADMGSSFGSGSAGSLFGAAGAANFLSRTTKWAAIAFFASTAGLAWVSHQPAGSRVDSGVMQGFEVPQVPASVPSVPNTSVPAAPAAASDASVPSVAAPAAEKPAESASVPVAPPAESSAPAAEPEKAN
ncbi:MAG TPA: preprotein translocase subunit SecG [Burkholderiaceae bacterium]|jgi:preprotein translocase subunit SecG|nr:preprotein translocase subunit SecG [Burkholderiaceae bacterium]